MILADHPGDTIARFHLATSPLAESLGFSNTAGISNDTTLEKHGDINCSHRIRADLITKGYGETIRKYAEVLAPFCDPHEFLRLEKLLELAYRFDEENDGIRTNSFIEKVNNTSVAEPSAANITVSTIHGAKGLEYDIVVLPELGVGIDGKKHTPQIVVEHATPGDKTTPVSAVLRYADANLQKLLPAQYQKMFEEHTQNEVEESLSELYVAVTRAIYQLVMIAAPKTGDAVSKTFEGVLRHGFKDDALKNSATLPEGLLYKTGNEKWYEKIPVVPAPQIVKEYQELTCIIPDKKVHHHVPRTTPSRLHSAAIQETTLQELTQRESTQRESTQRESTPRELTPQINTVFSKAHGNPLEWGTAMHACLEHGAEWLDEANEITDSELVDAVTESIRGKEVAFTAEDVVAQYRVACKSPEVVQALSRSRYRSPDVIVERERPFTVWAGNKMMSGVIDRLVVCRDTAGCVTEIEIIDYKSDAAADVKSLVATYREQLEAYRKGMATLFRLDAAKIKATFVFTTLGKVETV